ncbi:MAG: hypothetical protein VX589_11720 [Myxococcota bacterium]|nr:hypothetical protein [Myxococcota bacterium]
MLLFALVSRLALISSCASPVQITGPQAPALLKTLKTRSHDGSPPTACEPVSVHVTATDEGVVLERAGYGSRILPDVTTAALIVETWTRPDLLDPLLAARTGVGTVVVTPVSEPMTHLNLAWVMSACERGDAWTGIQASGCMQFGHICPGIAIQGLMDTVPIEGRNDVDRSRVRLSVLAMTELVLGQVRIGVGAGATAMRVPQSNGRDTIVGGPLVAGRTGYSFPLWGRLALDLALTTDLALWPRSQGSRSRDQDRHDPSHWLFSGTIGFRWVIQ